MRKEFSAGAIIYYLDTLDNAYAQPLYLVLHYGTRHWDFAKGKLEPGEDNPTAAMREIKEETGLSPELNTAFEHKIFYKFKARDREPIDKQVTFFVARTNTLDVLLSDEHSEYRWLSYDEARHLLTYQNAVDLLDRAHAYITQTHQL